MTKKFTKIEMFQELSVILARIEAKVDKLQKDIDGLKPEPTISDKSQKLWEEATKRQFGHSDDNKCVFDNMSSEDRLKPMSISCPCKKCSPYCLSSGSLSDSGTVQTWRPSGDVNL